MYYKILCGLEKCKNVIHKQKKLWTNLKKTKIYGDQFCGKNMIFAVKLDLVQEAHCIIPALKKNNLNNKN